MKFLYLLSLQFLTSAIFSQNIVINELQPNNLYTYETRNPFDSFPDWIELHNTTSSPIDIGGYFLSDDPDNKEKWKVPDGTIIDANGFLIIHAVTNLYSVGLESNFKLSSNGETITLSDSTGAQIQQLIYPATQNDISYGRLSDGSYSFMNIPTPEASNNESSMFKYLDSTLKISIPSGIYAEAQSVELTNTGAGTIFYTLDGTTPSSSSLAYSGSLAITSNTVLKAIVVENDNSYSTIENRSYIIGAKHDLPIVLLTSDNSSIKPSNSKEIIDGRVEFNFIETDGTTVINQYADFRASGRTSKDQPQLNGKLEARKIYGDSDFDHKMYPYKDVDEFNSFLLRNASQDWSETHMRDAFISRLLGKDNLADFPFEGYRPAVLYVNTIYQGIINVREDDDSSYVKNNFNLDKDEFKKYPISNFIQLENPLPTNREAVDEIINFDNFTNVRFLINYTELNEYGFKNWEDISGKTGQRYHYFMHDFDAIFGLGGEDYDTLLSPMPVNSLLSSNLNVNPDFKTEALQFIAAAINHFYNTDRAIGILEEMEAELESEIPAHAIVNFQLGSKRYNKFNEPPFANLAEWKANVADLKKEIESRISPDIFNRIQAEYSLDAPIEVTYKTTNINHGFIKVHNIKLLNETNTGTYFSNIPLKLSAEALPGFKFIRWEGDVKSLSSTIAPVFDAGATLTAVFEPIPVVTNTVVINEVQGKNDTIIADTNGEFDDWIEIYNPSDVPVNLADYFISDNVSEPLKWKIPNTNEALTTVPAKGYLLLWADNDLDQGEDHLGFKLKGTDQVVLTYPDGITEKQSIAFKDLKSDESFGAESDASTDYIVFGSPTPNASNKASVLSVNAIDSYDEQAFTVYPNPTTSKVVISSNLDTNKLNWSVFDFNGTILKSGTGNTIFMENLSAGLYFVAINKTTVIKVIKN